LIRNLHLVALGVDALAGSIEPPLPSAVLTLIEFLDYLEPEADGEPTLASLDRMDQTEWALGGVSDLELEHCGREDIGASSGEHYWLGVRLG